MKQKLNLILKVVLACMLVCFISCEREESLINNQELAQEKTQTEKIKDAEKWFNAYTSLSKIGKSVDVEINKAFQNIDYYWENADIISFDNDSTAVVVPIKDTPEDPNYKGQKMLYLYPANSKYQSVIQEIFPDSDAIIDDNQKREGFENLNSFSGYIITWDLKKGFIKGARFKNDTITEEVTNVKMVFDADKKSFTGKMEPMFDEGDGVGAERTITVRGGSAAIPLNNVIVAQKSPAPTPKDYSIGGAFGGDLGLKGYLNTPRGGGGTPKPTPVVIKITDNLTGKAKCLNTLLTKNGNSFVQKLLAKFEGTSEFNIKIVSVDKIISQETKQEVNGSTAPPVNQLIVINISTSKADLNGGLEVARTILHEYIHADIFGKLYTGDSQTATTFKQLYDQYGTHHGVMAGLYLSSMKEALKEFHKTVLIDDYNKYISYYGEAPSDAFYEAMAWSGLRDNNVKAWTDLPADKKASIEKLADRVTKLSKSVPCPN